MLTCTDHVTLVDASLPSRVAYVPLAKPECAGVYRSELEVFLTHPRTRQIASPADPCGTENFSFWDSEPKATPPSLDVPAVSGIVPSAGKCQESSHVNQGAAQK